MTYAVLPAARLRSGPACWDSSCWRWWPGAAVLPSQLPNQSRSSRAGPAGGTPAPQEPEQPAPGEKDRPRRQGQWIRIPLPIDNSVVLRVKQSMQADPGRRPRRAARLRARIRRAGRGRRRRSRHAVRRRPQAGPLPHQRRTQRGQHGGLRAQGPEGPCRAGGHGLRADHHGPRGHDGRRRGRRKSDRQDHARGLRRDRPQPPHRAAARSPWACSTRPARCSR